MESRLFRIVYYLLGKERVTAAELAEKLEVSVRTIYRDMDALSGAGIPVYAESGRNGGIYLMKNFVLDRAVLSEKEKRDILAGLQSLTAAGDVCGTEMLTKLSALFQINGEDWFEVDFSRWGNKAFDNEKFELLKQAVICHRSVQLVYQGAYGGESTRKVQPLKLLYKSKEWYLKAYCMKREAFRLFKLNRIVELKPLDEEFVPAAYPEMEEEQEPCCGRIILRFPKKVAYRVYDEFERSQIQIQENGDLVVYAEMPQDEWLTGYLLSFGAQVEVIEPVYLRGLLAEKAWEIYEKNKT